MQVVDCLALICIQIHNINIIFKYPVFAACVTTAPSEGRYFKTFYIWDLTVTKLLLKKINKYNDKKNVNVRHDECKTNDLLSTY